MGWRIRRAVEEVPMEAGRTTEQDTLTHERLTALRQVEAGLETPMLVLGFAWLVPSPSSATSQRRGQLASSDTTRRPRQRRAAPRVRGCAAGRDRRPAR